MFVVERGNLCTHDPKFVLGFIRLRCSRVFGDYRPVCNALFHKVSALVIERKHVSPWQGSTRCECHPLLYSWEVKIEFPNNVGLSKYGIVCTLFCTGMESPLLDNSPCLFCTMLTDEITTLPHNTWCPPRWLQYMTEEVLTFNFEGTVSCWNYRDLCFNIVRTLYTCPWCYIWESFGLFPNLLHCCLLTCTIGIHVCGTPGVNHVPPRCASSSVSYWVPCTQAHTHTLTHTHTHVIVTINTVIGRDQVYHITITMNSISYCSPVWVSSHDLVVCCYFGSVTSSGCGIGCHYVW